MRRNCIRCGLDYDDRLKRPPKLPPNAKTSGICPDCWPEMKRISDQLIAQRKMVESTKEQEHGKT